MYEILKSSFGKDSTRAIRPYQNVQVLLVENECDLKNELLVLKDSIREIMRAVLKMADVNSFGQFLIKDELLNRLLLFIKNLDEEDRETVLWQLSGAHRLMSMGYIGKKSFEWRKKFNPNRKTAGLPASGLSKEEWQRLTDELLSQAPDRYSVENVQKHFDRLMRGKKQLCVEESEIRTRDDAIMIAASIIYSGTEGFSHEVELGNGMVETKVARIRQVTVKRRES